MSEGFEWGPWVEHDGLRVPVPAGTLCQVETRDGYVITDTSHGPLQPDHASLWIWSTLPEPFRFLAIVRYRLRHLQAMDDLRALAADPYAPPPLICPDSPVRLPNGVPA